MPIRAGQGLNRRQWLVRSAATCAVAGLGSIAKPYLSRAGDRPLIASGIQSGDVSADSAVIWARADRAARMRVECSTAEDFKRVIATASGNALPDRDFTSKVLVEGLPAGQDIFYRVRFEDIDGQGLGGEAQIGRLRTAPAARSSVSFAWSGDTTGQGWGIDESRGGLRTYRTMLDNRPDFFIHSGDHIYADCPVERELKLPDGGTWRNVVTEEKSVVAQTLAQFRGNYKYNWLDPNFRAFHEFMPMRATPQQEDGWIYRKIAYGPLLDIFMIDMRSYRDSTFNKGDDRDTCLFGAAQLAWLKRELVASDATWKVIAADMPIGLYSEDGIALGDGPPARREHEIANLLSFMKRAGIRNTVWLTADMHYTAAHHYDPNRAAFQDFEPFWEFVSGPLHAGTWAPAPLDNTFGPKALFQKGCDGENLAPCYGMQFFGRVDIDGKTGVMTVTLKDVDNRDLWSVDLEPRPDARPGRFLAQHI